MNDGTYTPSLESAQQEIRIQMEQAFALVSAANDQLRGILQADANRIELHGPNHLLDMAEEKLGEHKYLNVVAPPTEPEHAQ